MRAQHTYVCEQTYESTGMSEHTYESTHKKSENIQHTRAHMRAYTREKTQENTHMRGSQSAVRVHKGLHLPMSGLRCSQSAAPAFASRFTKCFHKKANT